MGEDHASEDFLDKLHTFLKFNQCIFVSVAFLFSSNDEGYELFDPSEKRDQPREGLGFMQVNGK